MSDNKEALAEALKEIAEICEDDDLTEAEAIEEIASIIDELEEETEDDETYQEPDLIG